jgi:transposase InsO family protein
VNEDKSLSVLGKVFEGVEPTQDIVIMNTDQGCQYTSQEWIDSLKDHDIRISMDGRGRCKDNTRRFKTFVFHI